MNNNLILKTDSYKLTHGAMYPDNTKGVYSYLEARTGARDPYTVFFGLQALLKDIADNIVTLGDMEEARGIADVHLGPGIFNEKGWRKVIHEYGGRLPLRIKAVAEGTPVPVGNVMMTVENTDPDLYWLTNALESKLLHVWAPTTVATTSRQVKMMLYDKLHDAGHSDAEIAAAIDFMLHDFGYRGVSSKDESAAIGGAGHLVNFLGTDTLVALRFARDYYGADLSTLGFSVPATEHSIMTSQGAGGVRPRLVQTCSTSTRPASCRSSATPTTSSSSRQRSWGPRSRSRCWRATARWSSGPTRATRSPGPRVAEHPWDDFGGTETSKGFRVLDPHVGALWGDGLDGPDEIERIVDAVMAAGFSPDPTSSSAWAADCSRRSTATPSASPSSAPHRSATASGCRSSKDPLDKTKASKPGRLSPRTASTARTCWRRSSRTVRSSATSPSTTSGSALPCSAEGVARTAQFWQLPEGQSL
jgi:nicotinamide phosphoribosyltransferase